MLFSWVCEPIYGMHVFVLRMMELIKKIWLFFCSLWVELLFFKLEESSSPWCLRLALVGDFQVWGWWFPQGVWLNAWEPIAICIDLLLVGCIGFWACSWLVLHQFHSLHFQFWFHIVDLKNMLKTLSYPWFPQSFQPIATSLL